MQLPPLETVPDGQTQAPLTKLYVGWQTKQLIWSVDGVRQLAIEPELVEQAPFESLYPESH